MSRSTRNLVGNFYYNCMKSVDQCFSSWNFYDIVSFCPWTWSVSLVIWSCSMSFSKSFWSFSQRSWTYFVRRSLALYAFGCCCKWYLLKLYLYGLHSKTNTIEFCSLLSCAMVLLAFPLILTIADSFRFSMKTIVQNAWWFCFSYYSPSMLDFFFVSLLLNTFGMTSGHIRVLGCLCWALSDVPPLVGEQNLREKI